MRTGAEKPKALSNGACGAFKVPTQRNAAQRPFYFHNGFFTDLVQTVRFYVQRDSHPERWYPQDATGKVLLFNNLPRQHARNVNRDEVPYNRKRGQKERLNDAEIADVAAFIKVLDDGFKRRRQGEIFSTHPEFACDRRRQTCEIRIPSAAQIAWAASSTSGVSG